MCGFVEEFPMNMFHYHIPGTDRENDPQSVTGGLATGFLISAAMYLVAALVIDLVHQTYQFLF